MVRALLILLPLALTLYTFVDCAMRDDSQIKKIPKSESKAVLSKEIVVPLTGRVTRYTFS